MDSSNVSKLKIIQESSDAAAKDLDFFHLVRLGTREGRDPRLGPETRGPRGSRPENGSEHGMEVRLLSTQGYRSEMHLKTSPARTIKS